MGLIYLDTSILIHAVEDNSAIGDRIRQLVFGRQGDVLAISPLVKMECLVGPRRNADASGEHYYERAFALFRHLPITEEAFDTAANLRARFGLNTPDALHLGTAITQGCTALWTNDNRLAAASRKLALNILD